MNNISIKSSGWNWSAFILGPIWYLFNGLVPKGIILLFIAIITLGFGIPIIWVYCGIRGDGDLYERNLKRKSKFDINKL